MKISNIFSQFYENFSANELIEYVVTLAKFHRIQGSKDLENSAKYIYNILKHTQSFNVKTYEFSYKDSYGLHDPVVGWNLESCEVEILKPIHMTIASSIHSKNCAVAHSPPGSVEGEVIYVGSGVEIESLKSDELRNKIVLSHGNPYIVYKTLVKTGAIGFMFYKTNVDDNAIPYLSLFLTPSEADEYAAPAVSIPRKVANRILRFIERGDKVVVRIDVKANYSLNANIVTVEASLDDRDSNDEVHLFAHYCHPSYEINDNVSGSATLLELVLTIDRLVSKGFLKPSSKKKLVFVWFPEYYGSLPYLMNKVIDKATNIVFGINLDMIGEKQDITKSTLNLVLPPSFISNPLYEALLIKILINALSTNNPSFNGVANITKYRFDILPYEGGSDHDIYLQFSIPSVMLNQWPDIFYHTNLDDIHKFDPEMAKLVGVSIGVFSYIVLTENALHINPQLLVNEYRSFRHGYKTLKLCDMEYEASTTIYAEKYRYKGPKGVLSLRYIVRRMPQHRLKELLNIVEKEFNSFLLTRYIPLLLMNNALSLEEIRRGIWNEYCINVNTDTLRKLIHYLTELNLIEVISSENLPPPSHKE
ncbi:DUF4910 domain-containing protein [Ignisphaera sp. 4213-co]|uniref:DUF4910 domain-containing protein n=1 Tax=Ignisphaera cupida TaxID=3050454 RepID=A0ABD4Z7I5_9CREN|nr:DUF4910 domain-containing protein [Ignisphaera sp. 4213-co]MDK6029094.1 DUF4910 domain-containing protein [Ignisphaera sp. 4213-co]